MNTANSRGPVRIDTHRCTLSEDAGELSAYVAPRTNVHHPKFLPHSERTAAEHNERAFWLRWILAVDLAAIAGFAALIYFTRG